MSEKLSEKLTLAILKKRIEPEKFYGLAVNAIFIFIVLVGWECVTKAHILGNNSEQLLPPLESIGRAFVKNFATGHAGSSLLVYIGNSMKLLLEGMLIGCVLAIVFSGLSIISKTFHSIYNMIVTICDLLPGMAILPVVIVIFGIKQSVIVFLVIHAIIWPLSRNIMDGFMAVSQIYIDAGRNIGLEGSSLLLGVYIPASSSYIISGIKVGWARAWRGLISAEMIFGIASCPGIGLYINQMRTTLKTAEMYATLVVIIIIGLIVQYGILAPIENCTVKRWGMSR